MTRIKSTYIFPGSSNRNAKLPENYAEISRQHAYTNALAVKEEWPAVAVGETFEIETTDHWLWTAKLVEVVSNMLWIGEIIGTKKAMPLPPIVEGKPYQLPFMSGDAWSVRPEKGKVLTIEGRHYKTTTKPKAANGGYIYNLEPVTPEAHAVRPGRVQIKDLTETDPKHFNYYQHNVGRIINVGQEFFHVKSVTRQSYGSGEGEVFGYQTFGQGNFIPAEKAAKLNAKWEALKLVRSLEHSLKVASQDVDYGGDYEAIPGIKTALEAAKKAAKIK